MLKTHSIYLPLTSKAYHFQNLKKKSYSAMVVNRESFVFSVRVLMFVNYVALGANTTIYILPEVQKIDGKLYRNLFAYLSIWNIVSKTKFICKILNYDNK